MSGQSLDEYLRPAGLPDLHDIGKRVMTRLADDLRQHFPEVRVAPDVSGQVESLISGHPEEQVFRHRHQLVLAWLKQSCA